MFREKFDKEKKNEGRCRVRRLFLYESSEVIWISDIYRMNKKKHHQKEVYMMKKRKMMATTLAMLLICTSAACGGKKAETDVPSETGTFESGMTESQETDVTETASAQAKFETAAELYKAYAEKQTDNYHVDTFVDMNVAFFVDTAQTETGEETEESEDNDITLSMPMSMQYNIDRAGSNMHGYLGMHTDSDFADTKDMHGELYADLTDKDAPLLYTGAEDEEGKISWVKSDMSGFPIELENYADSSLFENAEMEYKDGEYIVKVDGAKLAELLDMSDLIDTFGEAIDANRDEMAKAFADAEATYTFNDKYQLTRINMTGFDYSYLSEETGVPTSATITLNYYMDFSQYGEIKADDLKIPDDVISGAAEEDAE